MPLASHEPASPDECVVFARGDERRHRIEVGGERDVKPLAELREHVVAARFHLQGFDVPAIPRRERAQPVADIQAHALFVVGDRFDIDQRPR